MEFRVLGPLEVAREAAPVPVGGPRERALLARLLLSVNQVVSSDTLAEDLWSGAPPEGAGQALWVYVSRLRKALRAHGGEDVVITRPPGYLLRVEPEAVDSCRFDALVEQGRRLAANGDPAAAAATFREALALWRGPALADVADAPFAKAEAARLEEARLAALEERIDADLSCGRHGPLVGELAGLTREHPLRERLWAQRMLGLYRAGRQAEALRAYQDIRRYLGEELGIEPGEELRRLEVAVLRHERGLDWSASEQPDGLGLSKPVAVCEVVRKDQPNPSTLSLPLRLERESSTFVGREEELRRLEVAWEEARSGRRQLVLLAGEPGIGKTCLAAEFAKRTHPGGAAVLFGRCDEGMGVPFQPFVEALDVYLREARTPALGRLAGELVRLVPEIPERIGDLPAPIHSDPETERYRLFDAVAAWLSAVSAQLPAVVVIDDLHWASRPTLSLLGHLLRSGEPLHLLVVSTYRDTDVTAELSDALADLMRQPGIERIRLGGLDEAGVAAYMEARARHQLDDAGRALAATVHARTAGNPFFVGQVVRHLAETEAIVRREGRWTPDAPVSTLGIPEGVRDVIARRLARLPAETGDLLALASVLGDRFELDVLVRASGEPEVSTLWALDPAIAARLITEAGDAAVEYRFVHALVRATLYDRLPRSRRVEFHRRAAKAIEAAHGARVDGDLPALAHHYARAGSDERPSAIDYATRAGDRALAQRAHDEAVNWYRQALDLLDTAGISDETQRCDLLISFGEAQRRAGDPAHRDTLLDAARLAQELPDPIRLTRAALANSRGFFSFSGEVDADRAATLEAALDALGDREPGLRARLLATVAAETVFSTDQERCHRLGTEALAVARRLGDPEVLGYVLSTGYCATFGLLDVDQQEESLAQLVAVSEQLEDPALRFWGATWRSVTAVLTADVPAAQRHVDAAAQLAEELRLPFMRWVAAYLRAALALTAGDPNTAEALVGRAFELAQAAGPPDAFRIYGGQLFWVRYDQGRLEEHLDLLARAVSRQKVSPINRAAFCLALCELERPEEARPHFRELAADSFSLPVGFAWLYVMAILSEVCARLGDAEAAALLLDRLAPHHTLLVTSAGVTAGPVAHYLGLLAATLDRHEEAEARYQEAARIEERIDAPAWLARTRLEWARMLFTRNGPGDAERASELLGQALETARALGLRNVERRAVDLRISLGVQSVRTQDSV